jgi:hypothetical protein
LPFIFAVPLQAGQGIQAKANKISVALQRYFFFSDPLLDRLKNSTALKVLNNASSPYKIFDVSL